MAVFGYGNYSVLHPGAAPHNSTVLDTRVNYIYASVLVIVGVIGLTLNPVVFYFNHQQKRSDTTTMLQVIQYII